MSLVSVVGSQSLGSWSGLQEPDLAALRSEDSRFDQAGDARILGLGEGFCDAVVTLVEAVLLEPCDGPAAVRIEVAFLLGEHFVEGTVDQLQRLAHGQGLALGVHYLGGAREHRHARTDCCLREIDRRDVAGL